MYMTGSKEGGGREGGRGEDEKVSMKSHRESSNDRFQNYTPALTTSPDQKA